MKLSLINDDRGYFGAGYPGSGTGGLRSSSDKSTPEPEDANVETDNTEDAEDFWDQLKDLMDEPEYQGVHPKEPDDELKPKTATGPGA